jgi:predicted ArsR family transcriptional regulator
MATTREKILQTLLTRRRCTINELAEAVGINPISVRHHVNKLEAGGLVVSEEERHGVGRPRLVYFLTEKGMEHFPSHYLRLTVRLLKQLKETLPQTMVNELFTRMASELAADYADGLDLEHLPFEERLDVVKDMLSAEGFTVEWGKGEDGYYIRESSCPYLRVGQSHPEICMVDETLIAHVLEVPVEKVKCVLQGDEYCTYVISHAPVQEEAKDIS